MPNGELSAKQLRWLGDAIASFKELPEGGCGDITTRGNIQLRGMTLAESDKIFAVCPQSHPLVLLLEHEHGATQHP